MEGKGKDITERQVVLHTRGRSRLGEHKMTGKGSAIDVKCRRSIECRIGPDSGTVDQSTSRLPSNEPMCLQSRPTNKGKGTVREQQVEGRHKTV
jgi:hypothetical protein